MLRVVALILICATADIAAETAPCFAFLLKGDVVVSCGGRKFAVTHTDAIVRFAISEAAATLRLTHRTSGQKYRATEVNLQSGDVRDLPVEFGPTAPSGVRADGTVTVIFDQRGLCTSVSSGLPTCLSDIARPPDLPSVDNNGAVLLALGTDRQCFYKTEANFSPRTFPGATLESADECLAIALWKPGWKFPEIIEPLGRNPQWITPKTADLLRRQSKTQPYSKTTPPRHHSEPQ